LCEILYWAGRRRILILPQEPKWRQWRRAGSGVKGKVRATGCENKIGRIVCAGHPGKPAKSSGTSIFRLWLVMSGRIWPGAILR